MKREKEGVSIKIEREKKMNILIEMRKKWLGVLIRERKIPIKEMCYFSWDKLKRKMYHHKQNGGSRILGMC